MMDDQPLAGLRISLAGRRWFVARCVDVAEELAVKLGEPARIGGVQDHLPKNRERTVAFRCHIH